MVWLSYTHERISSVTKVKKSTRNSPYFLHSFDHMPQEPVITVDLEEEESCKENDSLSDDRLVLAVCPVPYYSRSHRTIVCIIVCGQFRVNVN